MKLHERNIFILLFIVFLGACKSPDIVKVDRNLSYIYNPGTAKLYPRYTIFHENDTKSVLIGKIFPNQLLFNQANPENELQAKAKVSFELYELDDNGKIGSLVDSLATVYKLTEDDVKKRFFFKMPVQAKLGEKYILKIKTEDVLRKVSAQAFINVDKKNLSNSQFFKISGDDEEMVLFEPYVVGYSSFKIFYAGHLQEDSLYISYYATKGQLPNPVFFEAAGNSDVVMTPDSIWKVSFKDGIRYRFDLEGMFFIQTDTSLFKGLTVMNFGADFPKVTTPDLMLYPLVYITNTNEYRELEEKKNRKLAMDNFWLGKSENIARAKELIRIYYTRVYFANYYFTSYKEGWETDRGMVYIIYGPPNSLEKDVHSERWTYYKSNSKSPVSFQFVYNENKFSDDDYILKRSESYNISWRQAVNSWREGEVFQLND